MKQIPCGYDTRSYRFIYYLCESVHLPTNKQVFGAVVGDRTRVIRVTGKKYLPLYYKSKALGHGVGAVLVTPDDQCIPFMARLGFDCTNNMAEYEASTLGI